MAAMPRAAQAVGLGAAVLQAVPGRGRWRHSDAAPHGLHREPLMEHTGRCQYGFGVQGGLRRASLVSSLARSAGGRLANPAAVSANCVAPSSAGVPPTSTAYSMLKREGRRWWLESVCQVSVPPSGYVRPGPNRVRIPCSTPGSASCTWEKRVLSARGFKRVGRRSEHAI